MFTREVVFRPAYDHRDEGHGQHCVEMVFYLKGPQGTVQFLLFTGWAVELIKLPEQCRTGAGRNRDIVPWNPIPADLGYHSFKPMYEGQEQITEKCDAIGGVPCYYDGSGLNADRIFSLLVHEGSEAVWKSLEDYYYDTFGM